MKYLNAVLDALKASSSVLSEHLLTSQFRLLDAAGQQVLDPMNAYLREGGEVFQADLGK
jgi:hypothetical protein